jgi:hypothetical protein
MKILKTEHVNIKMNLHRNNYNSSEALIFIEDSIHDIPRTVIFPEINLAQLKSNKFDNLSIYIARLISTESYIVFLCLKNLLELNLDMNMFQ